LSAQVAEQLHSTLGVESIADLTLLEPKDLSEVLRLPLIPQRKLVKCVCDGSLLPLSGTERSVEDRPLCSTGDRIVITDSTNTTAAVVEEGVKPEEL
jgi:hypothetical protein